MATSLFDKARVAVFGKLHELLDEVANTPEAYKQRIRDLERALADLRAAGDEAQGSLNGINRRQAELETSKAATLSDIDLILGDGDPSNDEAAITLQERVLDMEDSAATLAQQAESVGAEREQLLGAIDKLQAKHRQMVHDLGQLSMTQAATAAKNRAAEAAEAAAAASSAASDASIDSIAERIKRDKDVADARFDRVIGDLQGSSSPEEAVRRARAVAALQARQAKIAAQAAGQATAD